MRDCCKEYLPEQPAVRDDRAGFTVALAGNPNSGKSTLFNALTGARQHTGNWPGKTVERREGRFVFGGSEFTVVDLPGTYSLSAFSTEEIVALDYLLDARPDVVVCVVDAGNLERNLYLTVQLMELGLPVIVALNMMDEAAARGLKIDSERLSQALGGVPVVPTVARRAEGLEALKQCILSRLAPSPQRKEEPKGEAPAPIDYGPAVESTLSRLMPLLAAHPALADYPSLRWLALRLLEGDPHITGRVQAHAGTADLLAAAHEASAYLAHLLGDDPDILIADRRYGWINQLVREVVRRPPLDRPTFSDRLDAWLTHPLLGLPVFFVTMWLVFQMTTRVSAPFVDWIDTVINSVLAGWMRTLLSVAGLSGTWLESLIAEGIIAGVGGVLVFVPVLAFMYLFIAMLEDSGYMARAAFLMDRFMHLIGLHGKSFIPMLLGFGCNVPGVYATRTLENERDRILTGLLVPFMSCGARLPVYMLIGTVFFGAQAGALVFALYVLGIVMAILIGLILRRTLLRSDEEAPFVIELPPYRLPALKGLLIHTWERTWSFIKHASTVILAASVVVWLLVSIPINAPPGQGFAAVDAEYSALAALSRWLAPAFRPAGFGMWQAASSLVTGFVAKEVIVSTLSVVYVGQAPADPAAAPLDFMGGLHLIGVSFLEALVGTFREVVGLLPGIDLAAGSAVNSSIDPALVGALRGAFTPLSAAAFCVFVLLTAPCITTMSAQRHEFGTRWMVVGMAIMLLVAWTAAVVVYQGGMALGLA